MAEDKQTAFIDIVFERTTGAGAAGAFVEVEDHHGKSIIMGEWVDSGVYIALRLPLQRGTWPLREAGTAIQNLREHQRQLDSAGTEVAVSRQALDEALDAFKTVLQAIDDRAAVMFDGGNVAYAEVVRAAGAVADDPTVSTSDKIAIRSFVARFQDRAAMAVPATSQKG